MLQHLYRDERGFVTSTELILLATITVIGLIVGLAVWRDAVVQEMGDSAAAVGQLDQSYSVFVDENPEQGITVNENLVTITRVFGDDGQGGPIVTARGCFANFGYVDRPDVGDMFDVAGVPPSQIQLGIPPEQEGN